MVGPPGFEPGTSPLSGARSDQLSYGPSRVRWHWVRSRPTAQRHLGLRPVPGAAAAGLRRLRRLSRRGKRAEPLCPAEPRCAPPPSWRRTRATLSAGAARGGPSSALPSGGRAHACAPDLPRRFPGPTCLPAARGAAGPSAQRLHNVRCCPVSPDSRPPRIYHPSVTWGLANRDP